ncbi:MAG: molybdenum cofactor guanylyltransferase [Deltaproteobacteria bacterium]|nr:molybdenum cofactor guanylyltransferase [Deltaproteobacteria bacterium]
MRHPDIFAAILVGGRGSRMGGADKARLREGDRTFVERLVAALAPVVAEVVLCGRAEQDYPETGCRLIADRHQGVGPLGGLEAALAAAPVPWCFLVACDMPAVDGEVLDRLAAQRQPNLQVVVPRTARLEPACALYHVDALTAVRAALARCSHALHHLVAALPHVEVAFEADLAARLRNVNRTGD